jgi:hypothetical protein
MSYQSARGNLYAVDEKSSAPRGYSLGMAESYRGMRSRLSARNRDAVIRSVVAPLNRNNSADVLVRYEREFKRLDLNVAANEADRLRAIYVALYELGIKESDGRYYMGADFGPNKSATEKARMLSIDPGITPVVGSETEAGLFQSSWNFSKYNDTAKDLFYDFKRGRRNDNLLTIFSQGAGSPGQSDLKNYGSGIGVEFQQMAKSSPSFAVEYAALTLRNPGTNNYYFTAFYLMEFKTEVLTWLRSLED